MSLRELTIPAREGRAFRIERGQVFRIFPLEDGQVADCVFYNANDTREWFHVGQTWAINAILKTGTAKSFKHFYSKPPRENLMLTTLADTYPNHFGNMGGRCSAHLYKLRNAPAGHRSCQDNLAEALAPFGLSADEVMDVFNLFMSVDLHTDGGYVIRESGVKKSDYIELRAEMDVLAAVSACPADNIPVNNWKCSPIGVRIYE